MRQRAPAACVQRPWLAPRGDAGSVCGGAERRGSARRAESVCASRGRGPRPIPTHMRCGAHAPASVGEAGAEVQSAGGSQSRSRRQPPMPAKQRLLPAKHRHFPRQIGPRALPPPRHRRAPPACTAAHQRKVATGADATPNSVHFDVPAPSSHLHQRRASIAWPRRRPRAGVDVRRTFKASASALSGDCEACCEMIITPPPGSSFGATPRQLAQRGLRHRVTRNTVRTPARRGTDQRSHAPAVTQRRSTTCCGPAAEMPPPQRTAVPAGWAPSAARCQRGSCAERGACKREGQEAARKRPKEPLASTSPTLRCEWPRRAHRCSSSTSAPLRPPAALRRTACASGLRLPHCWSSAASRPQRRGARSAGATAAACGAETSLGSASAERVVTC